MLDIGTELAKQYRVDSWLGRGPLGNIYLAEDLEQHRPVAIKELRPELAADPTFMWGLRHEAQVLNENPQPQWLRPEGVVETDQGAYVVVNYAPGMGLQELEDHWPGTGYFVRSWDNPPTVGTGEDALAAEPSLGTEAAGLAGAVEGGAGSASSAATAPGGEADKTSSASAVELRRNAGNKPAPAGTNPPESPQESAPVAVGAGLAAAQDHAPAAPGPGSLGRGERGASVIESGTSEASDFEPTRLPGRALWPMPSSTTIGVLLLTILVIALAIAAWLRGPRLIGQDPTVRAAPGVLASGTSTPSPSATPAVTRAPEVALVPSASSSATPSPTPTQPAAVAPATTVPTTAAPAGPEALIQAPANLRSGPGPNYPVLTVLQPGDQAAITGQSPDGSWWQVRTADGQSGWLFTSLVTSKGKLDQVPVVSAPSPTALAISSPASPTPTATQVPTDKPAPTATQIPTDTPAPVATQIPTDTPAPTATETPTDTPAPTASASASAGTCSIAPAGPFAHLPVGQDLLGCPIGGPSSTDFAHQEFEHGQMLYRHDLRTIYVLYLDGTWVAFHDNYVEGQPFQLQQLDPPNGLKQPIKGFDRVWEQPAVRERLGWATRDEASVIKGPALAFERGQAMWVDRPDYLTALFVLFADGTWAEYR